MIRLRGMKQKKQNIFLRKYFSQKRKKWYDETQAFGEKHFLQLKLSAECENILLG